MSYGHGLRLQWETSSRLRAFIFRPSGTWGQEIVFERLARKFVKTGDLTITDAKHRTLRLGDGRAPHVAVRFADERLKWQLIYKPELALGEAYMDGRLVLQRGSVADLLALCLMNLGTTGFGGPYKFVHRIRRMLRKVSQITPVRRARRNISHHYDLTGALYDLFLDTDKQYSCGYFPRPGMSLEEAQAEKKLHIAAKLRLEPGVRVLDIGSGWGGLALYLAQHGPSRVDGITLSEEQLKVANARARSLNLSERVRFELRDYRHVEQTYDRVVSVGMFEHVGLAHYREFFNKVAQILAENGVALLHTIGRSDGPGVTNRWIQKYIFPGGYTPALSEMLPAIEQAGLIVTDVETLRLHYAETLKAWRERFVANWERAKALYDERFCRMWEFYLAGAEMGFRHQGLVVYQIQMTKNVNALPLTRDYIGAWEEEHRPGVTPRRPQRPRAAVE